MKLTITRSNLLAALSRTAPIAKQKSTMPVLSCVLIRATDLQPITVSATNLMQSVTTRAPADVAAPGSICVDARALTDRVKTFPEGPISVTLADSHLLLSAGKRKHKLPVIPAEDFPPIAPAPEGGLTLPAASLATVLEQTKDAASDDAERTTIYGVFLEFAPGELRATATDGRRVHFASQPAPGAVERPGIILPIGAVEAILAVLDDTVTIGMSGLELGIRSGDTTLTTKLIEGQFPPAREYLSRMPQDGLCFDPSVLADSLSSVALGSKQGAVSGIVTLTVAEGELRISAGEAEDTPNPHSPFPSPPQVPPPPISLQSPFLLSALRCHTGPVLLRLPAEDLSPLFLTSADPIPHAPIAIVMPCRP